MVEPPGRCHVEGREPVHRSPASRPSPNATTPTAPSLCANSTMAELIPTSRGLSILAAPVPPATSPDTISCTSPPSRNEMSKPLAFRVAAT